MASGGRRPGAGRPKGTTKVKKAADIAALVVEAMRPAPKRTENSGSPIGQALAALQATAPDAPPLPESLTQQYDDPLDFLAAVMNEPKVPLIARQDAAKALMPYKHPKKGETGKKQQAADAAKTAGNRFTAGAPPLRAVSNA